MYGFQKTKCKINNCSNPVWPNKTLGYCSLHYQRNKTGRMNEHGNLLPLAKKTKLCDACGKEFVLGKMERNVRWCKQCKPCEHARIRKENSVGIYRRGKSNKNKKYIFAVLDKIILDLDKVKKRKEKYNPIIMARKSGETFRAIGNKFHITHQRAQQICAKYL